MIQEAPVSDADPAATAGKPVSMVGANLPARYGRGLALAHAHTGKVKKELLKEALEMLFAKYGVNTTTGGQG